MLSRLPSPTPLLRRLLSSASGAAEVVESTAYRRSKFRPPATVSPWPTSNSCSFIGTVSSPVTPYPGDQKRGKVFAFLDVHQPIPSLSLDSSKPFSLMIHLSGDLAQKALAHLKLNDFIYIRGPLTSFDKVHACGKREQCYKVFVEELNFVKHKNIENSKKQETSAEVESSEACSSEEKYRNRLHLWQVFFANPYEWWDNRRNKRNSKSPDFKHKDTGESLWLNPKDPTWIKKQLQIYDSEMATRMNVGKHAKVRQCDIEDLI